MDWGDLTAGGGVWYFKRHFVIRITRPVKSAGERRRRDAVQRKRLVAMGIDEATVAKLNAVQVRDYLRTPEKTKAAFAK